jgi:hypothetical protein
MGFNFMGYDEGRFLKVFIRFRSQIISQFLGLELRIG